MTINTKFNIGDVVYFLSANSITKDTINSIYLPKIMNKGWEPSIRYGLTSTQEIRDEYQLGHTKEELLKSL